MIDFLEQEELVIELQKPLENDRVQLRIVKQDDFDALWQISMRTPDLLRFSPSNIKTEQGLENYILSALNEHTHGARIPFVIYDKNSHEVAGMTSYGNIVAKHSRVEIGWTWIGKKFQRTGLNHNIKALMLERAFDELKIKRVEFKIDARNKASRNAVERIGGNLEGVLRSHTLMQDGVRRDTCYYGILDKEWKHIRKDVFGDVLTD